MNLLSYFRRAADRKLRVGFITPSLYWGGAERWMLDLARFSGHAIEWTGVACVSAVNRDESMVRLFEPLMPVREFGRRAVHQVGRRADVLVAWGAYDLAELVRGFRGPVVFVGHGSGHFDRGAARQAVPGATHCACVARASLEPFDGLVPLDQVAVLYNGIDPARCAQSVPHHEMRRCLGVRPNEFLVGYIGRMVPEKRPLCVARAVALLPRRYRAVFVGDGWDLAKQRKKILRTLGARAIFVDRVEDVGNYYRALDCFALGSPREGFSMGMLEAMLCGVPCALTNVGVLPELEEQHGRHWEPVEVSQHGAKMAAAIARVAGLSREQRVARTDRCRRIVESNYLARHLAERWIEYLKGVVSGQWSVASKKP